MGASDDLSSDGVLLRFSGTCRGPVFEDGDCGIDLKRVVRCDSEHTQKIRYRCPECGATNTLTKDSRKWEENPPFSDV